MSQLHALRERRAALAKDMRNLVDNNPGAAWKKNEHGKKFDSQVDELNLLDDEIGRIQTVFDLDAETAFTNARREFPKKDDEPGPRKLYSKWLRQGWEGLNHKRLPRFAPPCRKVPRD